MALTGKASDAVQTITSGIAALRSTGATVWLPLYLSYLARAYAELGQFDDARRSISEAKQPSTGLAATPKGASSGAAYMTITNNGKTLGRTTGDATAS